MSDVLAFFLGNFLPQLPIYLVWIAGLIVALLRWRQHPGRSLLIVLALLLFLARGFLYPLLYFSLVQDGSPPSTFRGQMQLLDIGSALFGLIPWLLLLVAILRSPGPSEVAA